MLKFKNHKDYWQNRKIDWKTQYFDTWDHPHRLYILQVLASFPWISLIELGVGGGANLYAIVKYFKGKQLGGLDINADAIEFCNKIFKGGLFKVGGVEDIMMSDKSVDIVLTDMTLIYISPRKIKKVIKELRRVTRGRVVLCEVQMKWWWQRLWLWWQTGYYAYDYKKLLKDFYDVAVYELPPDAYPGPKDFTRSIIVAVAPKKV